MGTFLVHYRVTVGNVDKSIGFLSAPLLPHALIDLQLYAAVHTTNCLSVFSITFPKLYAGGNEKQEINLLWP